MNYWDEDLNSWVDGEPHEDIYFPEPDEEEDLSPELILAIESLDPKHRFVLELRYGIRSGSYGVEYNQQEIASLMGISQQAVAQLEDTALAKLRSLVNFSSNTGSARLRRVN